MMKRMMRASRTEDRAHPGVGDRRWLLLFLVVPILPADASGQADAGSTGLTRDEIRADFERMARPNGYWVASNAAYLPAFPGEPEEYRMAFRRAPDGNSMRGCMWGATNGEATPVFWHFFYGWDPTRDGVLAYQSSAGGAVAIGWEHGSGDGEREAVQVLTAPNGSSRQIRHLNRSTHPDSMLSRSFERPAQGDQEWEARRTYTWVWYPTPDSRPC